MVFEGFWKSEGAKRDRALGREDLNIHICIRNCWLTGREEEEEEK